jgi:hypothetical protein
VSERRARLRRACRDKKGVDPLPPVGELTGNSGAPGRVRGRAAGAARGKMRRSGAEAVERGRRNCRPAGAWEEDP